MAERGPIDCQELLSTGAFIEYLLLVDKIDEESVNRLANFKAGLTPEQERCLDDVVELYVKLIDELGNQDF